MKHTAVRLSMQSINGSEVTYLESDNEYSFHSCAKRLWDAGMLDCLGRSSLA